MSKRTLVFLFWTCWLAVTPPVRGAAGPQRTGIWEWTGVDRVVAMGDLHGAYDKFVRLLEGAGLTDAELNWIGGADHLVVAGDFLDRGGADLDLMRLLRRLQEQAESAGGRVHVLLGNHESMNLLRDSRYVNPEVYRRFAADESGAERKAAWAGYLAARRGSEGIRELSLDFQRRFPPGYFARQRSFDLGGVWGEWLLSLPSVVKIDNVVFLHGGLTESFAALGVDGINRRVLGALHRHLEARAKLEELGLVIPTMTLADVRQAAADALREKPGVRFPRVEEAAEELLESIEDPVLGGEGPLWYRGNSFEDERIERRTVERALELLEARAMVVAHSYTGGNRITSRFHGRLFRLDHGILHSRRPLALVVEDGEALVLDSATRLAMRPVRELPPGMARLLSNGPTSRAEFERLLVEGEVVESREIGRGRTRPQLVVLERNGVRGRGVFKTVEEPLEGGAPVSSSDRFEHEVAAYRLAQRLGLDLVPPTVLRTIDGRTGSLQSWVEGAVDQEAAAEYGLELYQNEATARQLELGELFDALIGNLRRRPSDILCLVNSAQVFLIDHSEAFTTTTDLPWSENEMLAVEPGLAVALRQLDRTFLDDSLGQLLSDRQIEALLARRDGILGHVRRAETVTFPIHPPGND